MRSRMVAWGAPDARDRGSPRTRECDRHGMRRRPIILCFLAAALLAGAPSALADPPGDDGRRQGARRVAGRADRADRRGQPGRERERCRGRARHRLARRAVPAADGRRERHDPGHDRRDDLERQRADAELDELAARRQRRLARRRLGHRQQRLRRRARARLDRPDEPVLEHGRSLPLDLDERRHELGPAVRARAGQREPDGVGSEHRLQQRHRPDLRRVHDQRARAACLEHHERDPPRQHQARPLAARPAAESHRPAPSSRSSTRRSRPWRTATWRSPTTTAREPGQRLRHDLRAERPGRRDLSPGMPAVADRRRWLSHRPAVDRPAQRRRATRDRRRSGDEPPRRRVERDERAQRERRVLVDLARTAVSPSGHPCR